MEETRKEEILARSKRENRNGDERERTIRIQGQVRWDHSGHQPCVFGL